MKTPSDKSLLSVRAVLTLLIVVNGSFQSCREDERNLPALIDFTVTKAQIQEGDVMVIQLKLNQAPAVDVSVQVRFEGTARYNADFLTNPSMESGSMVLPIQKGKTMTEFELTAIKDAFFAVGEEIYFKLFEPSRGLQLGSFSTLRCSIVEDLSRSLIHFPSVSGSIPETDVRGIEIPIQFSPPPKEAGGLAVSISAGQAIYGIDFITVPEPGNGVLNLLVQPNEQQVSFKVVPLDNHDVAPDRELTFSISDVSSVFQFDENEKYLLTISNDETPVNVDFAEPSGDLSESDVDGLEVEILLSAPSPSPGSLTIAFSAYPEYGKTFFTVPQAVGYAITLPITMGQSKASFTILPINNFLCTPNQPIIDCAIRKAENGVTLGSHLSYKLSVVDDDKIMFMQFDEPSGILDEANSAGLAIRISISDLTTTSETIYIQGGWIDVNERVTSEPGFGCYPDPYYGGFYCIEPTLNLGAGVNSALFRVYPVNNSINERDAYILLSLASFGNAGCLKPAPGAKFDLSILDDDNE